MSLALSGGDGVATILARPHASSLVLVIPAVPSALLTHALLSHDRDLTRGLEPCLVSGL